MKRFDEVKKTMYAARDDEAPTSAERALACTDRELDRTPYVFDLYLRWHRELGEVVREQGGTGPSHQREQDVKDGVIQDLDRTLVPDPEGLEDKR